MSEGDAREVLIDGDVELLGFIPGESGGASWVHQLTDEGLRSAAELPRTVHDASRG